MSAPAPEPTESTGRQPLRIAFASSELAPFSKTGGLADVSAALPRALAEQGCRLQVFTPLYAASRARVEAAPVALRLQLPHTIWVDGSEHEVSYVLLEQEGYELVFVDCPEYFDRGGLYLDAGGRDFPDNVARFSLFCRAVLEYFLQSGQAPDVLHCHDWQTALLPIYLRRQYTQPQLTAISTVLTIHNLGYQGVFPPEALSQAGLGPEHFHLDGLEFYGQLNLLKGGIICADALTTVSPTYAREIQTEQFGHGLEGLLRAQRGKLSGILNGIDTQLWNPESDSMLPANFSAHRFSGKTECRRALQQLAGLPQRRSAMLLGMVTRLDVQKGVDLLLAAWPQLSKLDLQLVVLGTGSPQLEAELAALAQAQPQRVTLLRAFDEQIAHLIYAGADALLMPSIYEPCGLNQMYAQRYGTVPIVRQTGGLRDTVLNATGSRLENGKASGFSFKAAQPAKLAQAIKDAYKLFCKHPKQWQRLVRAIMKLEHGWESSAREYRRLYKRLLRDAAGRESSSTQRRRAVKQLPPALAEGGDA